MSDRAPLSHLSNPPRRRQGRSEAEVAAEVARLGKLAQTLDAQFRIPLTKFRIGVDGLIGLIPGVGDTIAAALAVYLIARGWQLGARKRTLVRMGLNTGVDWLIGMVPLVGDLFDIGFKSNLRNLRALQHDLTPKEGAHLAR